MCVCFFSVSTVTCNKCSKHCNNHGPSVCGTDGKNYSEYVVSYKRSFILCFVHQLDVKHFVFGLYGTLRLSTHFTPIPHLEKENKYQTAP